MAHPTIQSENVVFELPYNKNKQGNYEIIPKAKGYSGITVTNRKKYPDGYIYFVKIENQNIYKLGVSGNVKRRLQDISSNMPFELEILSIHFFKGVYDIEEELSDKYKGLNFRKEWYKFTPSQAKEIMIYLHNLNVKRDGIIQ